MLHSQACRHCGGQFRPVRTGHLYCSDTCRKLAFKAKNRAKTQAKRNRRLSEKLKKLANSAFGLYLTKEIRRAGTVEILQGHTAESLAALVNLRRQCTAAGGYEKGESLGYYELSHIYPVNGKERIGLLSSANLTIAPKEFNRRHGTKLPVEGYKGASIPKTSLLARWQISKQSTSLEVLKLVRKYLGDEFDVWLRKHLINQTQKSTLLKKFKEAGFDYEILKTMKLRELKALAEEEEIPHFSIDKQPDDLIHTALKELERLNLNLELTQTLKRFFELDDTFEPPEFVFDGSAEDLILFQEFITQQTFLCIHGQKFENLWRNRATLSFFKNAVKSVENEPKIYEDDDIL